MQSEILLLSNVEQGGIAQTLQKEFELLGIPGVKGKRIDADRAVLHKSVAEALSDYNIIMIIGGMGESECNITVEAVTSAIGYNVVEKNGELFPEGAEIFSNRDGKPSGCAIAQGNQCIMMLPGDSETLNYMLVYNAAKYIADFLDVPHSLKTLRVCDMTKSEAESALKELKIPDVKSLVFEDGDELAVQIFANAKTGIEAKETCVAAVKSAAEMLDGGVYAVDVQNVGQALEMELSKKGLCTAIAVEGFQKNDIIAGAYVGEYADHFRGISSGIERFEIPQKLLERYGKNSEWTSAVLAGEACKTEGCNIGISLTSDPEKPSSGAYYAVAMGDNVWTGKVEAKNREELIALAGTKAAHLARNVVSAYPKAYENSVSLMSAVSGKTKFNTTLSTNAKKKWYSKFIIMKGDEKSDIIRKSVFWLCIIVFVASIAYLGSKAMNVVSQHGLNRNLQALIGNNEYIPPRDWEYLDKFYGLYKENSDFIGYVKIDGTNVDYPVVQTTMPNEKGQKGQYYLRKDYYGAYSMYGTPFLDYRCNFDPDFMSKNLVVYGHNIYDDGQMFSDLVKYRKLSFYRNHPVINFDTLYKEDQWLVIGVVVANAYEKDGPIWDYTNFIDDRDSGEKTQNFIKELAKRTLIVTGVDYNVNDHFLTLSTCCYDFKDARMVIIARKLRDGEDISGIDTSKAYYNSNPLMPDKWYEALSKAQQSEADASFGEAEVIEENDIVSMRLLLDNVKYNYLVGESLSLDGITIQFTKLDDSVEEFIAKKLVDNLDHDFWFEPEEFLEPGEQKVTIHCDGFSASFMVNVASEDEPENKIESIKLTKPSKLNYNKGDTLDTSGLELSVTMTNEEILTVTEGFTCSPTVLNTPGTQTITVTYKDFTLSFNVTVNDPEAITAISILTKPAKLEYTVGDKLDTSGLTANAMNSSGSIVKVLKASDLTCSPATLDTVGKQTITVKYNGLSTSFDVTVKSNETSSSTSSAEEEEPSSTPESSVSESSAPESSDEEVLLLQNHSSAQGASSYYSRSLSDTFTINGSKMSIFDAVCQVVAYEAGYGQPDEYVKAQAVASYTYIKNEGGNVSAGVKTTITDQIERCVAEVIGYAVLDDKSNNYILSTYFSESYGITADAEWVWGYANRNLKSVSSSVDKPKAYTYTISSGDFSKKVKDKAGITLSGDPDDWMEIKSCWGNTDYVNEIILGGKTYSARKLRETVLGGSNLRSTVFDFNYNSGKDEFTFTSYGYGHGVGMSAKGAIAYANKGYDWDEILLKYYSNCYIGMKY